MMQNDLDMLKKELLRRLEEFFGTDRKRIEHAKQVLKYSEELLKAEQADPYIVFPAAVLHDVGIKAAEEKYGSAAPHHQEKEGPPVAGKILVDMGYEESNLHEILAIIAHHHSPGPLETENYRVVHDADWIVNLGEEAEFSNHAKRQSLISRVFLTDSGRRLAEKLYLEKVS